MGHKLSKEQSINTATKCAEFKANYCIANNIHYLVTGFSGGADSSLVGMINRFACEIAWEKRFKLHNVGVLAPCESHPDHERLGRIAIQTVDAIEAKADLTDLFEHAFTSVMAQNNEQIYKIMTQVGDKEGLANWNQRIRITEGNVKARLRMIFATYYYANQLGGIVCSTDNLSEYWMGFWTICGDVGDICVIQNILKGLELYDIAKHIGVHPENLAAIPTAGLGISKSDAEELGAEYPVIDETMIRLIQKGLEINGPLSQIYELPQLPNVNDATKISLVKRCLRNAYKRKGTVIPSREEIGLPPIKEIDLD